MAGLDRCKRDVRTDFTSQVVVGVVTTRKLRRVPCWRACYHALFSKRGI
jgi:hypothetical protein